MDLVATGFHKSAGRFFLFMLAMCAQNLAMSGIVYSISAGVGVLSAGQTIINMETGLSMVRLSACNVATYVTTHCFSHMRNVECSSDVRMIGLTIGISFISFKIKISASVFFIKKQR